RCPPATSPGRSEPATATLGRVILRREAPTPTTTLLAPAALVAPATLLAPTALAPLRGGIVQHWVPLPGDPRGGRPRLALGGLFVFVRGCAGSRRDRRSGREGGQGRGGRRRQHGLGGDDGCGRRLVARQAVVFHDRRLHQPVEPAGNAEIAHDQD